MELKRLNSDVISKIRSSFNVSNVAQCVFELICNSLDAKASSVAVRVNLISFKIQIADNGEGITKGNMELIGLRYMTNKCRTLKEFQKQLNTYGYRGESLASIIENSIKVSISSRSTGSSETFIKTMGKDVNIEVKTTKFRPSIGTTVTVFGFMSNIPVRQKRVIDEIELEGVKKCLENLIIINPMTSFSLRNDATGLLLLKSPKNADIIGSFRSLHQDINDSFELLKVSKHKVTIEGLFHKDFSLSKKYQYIYVNKRPVNSPKLQNHILKLFQKKYFAQNHPIYETKKYPMYVFHIRCPSSIVDILSNSIKSEVEFQSWDVIMACTDKILNTFLGLNEQKIEKMSLYSPEEVSCGVSKVFGAVQGRAFKRKSDEAFEKENNVEKGKNSKTEKVLSPGTDPTQAYEIYDSGKDLVKPSEHKKIVSILRKPLEIKVNRESKIKKQKSYIETDLNQPYHTSEGLDKEFLYSKPNSNEIQGKNFLLDKFLRSAQISNDLDQVLKLVILMSVLKRSWNRILLLKKTLKII
ncbi:DNA mismatch repair protein Mlh3-like [Sitophilus oryzae]|uniref:DNA mismatch repair protein Mlh3-like n=1 Tax=Sitophilus oryzae TaxID=7048 RepID=A0A6J2Y8V3_SITOR|nr:DNA mismatch repair protein Mlh3-like [Sitophilus oryzae]